MDGVVGNGREKTMMVFSNLDWFGLVWFEVVLGRLTDGIE
jgi:hypothetical protein